MWDWFIYRMRATNADEVVNAIAQNAEQIRRPNSGHSYHHVVVNVTHYRDGCIPELGYEDKACHREPQAWRHRFKTEQDILKVVHSRRKSKIFGRFLYMDELVLTTTAQLQQQYDQVWNRETERLFLRECEQCLRPQCYQFWQDSSNSSPAQVLPFEQLWHDTTTWWRWIKRYTSATSFPFIRPGLDAYKSDGFDLHGDTGKVWYAIVRFQY